MDSNNIITALLEENKLLKEDISKNKNEISLLKVQISKNQNDISMLINQNKSLWEEINKLKDNKKVTLISTSFNSKILNNSINEINFILDYIREHDKSFSFNNLNLLYRASRDGDRTETCHKLCDEKKNVLIIIKSEIGYIFGGFCKTGFRINNKWDYKIDNNCFLFSYQLKKIYPVIQNKRVICHISNDFGLCFYGSLVTQDNFMNSKNNKVNGGQPVSLDFRQSMKWMEDIENLKFAN